MASRSTTRDAIWNACFPLCCESATRAFIASPVRSMGGLSLVEKRQQRFQTRAKTDSGTANACIADPMLARATTCHGGARNERLYGAYCRGPQPVLRVSCPALAAQDEHGFSDEELINALANAATIGYLITRNATVAGAEGGCQAEVGASKRHGCKRGMRAFGGNTRTMLRGGEQCALRAHGPGVRPRRGPGRSALPEAQRHRASPTQSYRRKSRSRALAISRTSTKPLKPCGAWAIPFPSSFEKRTRQPCRNAFHMRILRRLHELANQQDVLNARSV